MSNLGSRKNDHINIVLNEAVEGGVPTFQKYRLPYIALPELDMEKIDLKSKLLDKELSFPFIISSMTGGLERGGTINQNLAIAAQREKVALGLGSMRVIIRYPETLASFQVRHLCPDVPLFANVGIVQLNYGFGLDELEKIVSGVEADGLFLHINHLQEAVQPEGDTNFENLLPKLEKIVSKLSVPIFAKEVGHGIDKKTAQRLKDIGIEYIDVSGTGGCSWAWIEGYRCVDEKISPEENLGYIFRNEGIPTDEALQSCSQVEGLKLIAGGGVRSGLDLAKAITMGAKYGTSAKPFLGPSLESPENVALVIQRYRKELQVAMFSCGAANLKQLQDISCREI